MSPGPTLEAQSEGSVAGGSARSARTGDARLGAVGPVFENQQLPVLPGPLVPPEVGAVRHQAARALGMRAAELVEGLRELEAPRRLAHAVVEVLVVARGRKARSPARRGRRFGIDLAFGPYW